MVLLKIFPVSLCSSNDQGFVIEEHLGELMKWDRNIERKKERFKIN